MSDTNVHRVVGNLLVGTSHFFVDTTTNRVGVNTSSPSASLDIATGDLKVGSGITIGNSGTITAANFSGNGSGLSGINSDSGSWVKDDANSKIYVSNTAHKVGVGTSSPGRLLEVYTGNGTVPGLRLRRGAGAAYTDLHHAAVNVPNTGDLEGLAIITSDGNQTTQEVMRICGNGNVGINTTSPASGLHVRNPGGADVASSIIIQPASTQYARGHTKIEAYPDATVGAGTGLKFYTRADSGSDFDPTSLVSARMTIKENGNVGVGSTSPTGRLEVEYTEGTLSSYSYATSSTWHNKGLALKGGNAGFLYGHDINHSIFLRQSPFGSTDHNAYCNVGYHAFYTGGHIQDQTEKMRIASDGVISISKYIEHKLISEASFVWDPSNTGTWNNHSNNIYNALGGNAYKATIIGGFQFHPDHIQATNNQFSIETDNTLDLRRSWTIVSWQRVTSGELTHIRVGGHGTTGGSQGLHIQGLGAEGMRYGMYSNDVDAGTNSGLRKTDKWAQYTATYSHTGTVSKKLYQNARMVADDRGTNTYNSSGTNGYPQYAAAPTKFRVGQSYSSGVYTTDSNTNLRVGPTLVFLDRVLDQSEVRALYEHYRMKYNGA